MSNFQIPTENVASRYMVIAPSGAAVAGETLEHPKFPKGIQLKKRQRSAVSKGIDDTVTISAEARILQEKSKNR